MTGGLALFPDGGYNSSVGSLRSGRYPMITLDDCIALCGLTEDEVLAIAEHEHLPAVAAAALGSFLVQQTHGMELLRNIIVDDIRRAQRHRDERHVRRLLHVLHHFLASHPEARPHGPRWSRTL
jgi:hypothetical protein